MAQSYLRPGPRVNLYSPYQTNNNNHASASASSPSVHPSSASSPPSLSPSSDRSILLHPLTHPLIHPLTNSSSFPFYFSCIKLTYVCTYMRCPTEPDWTGYSYECCARNCLRAPPNPETQNLGKTPPSSRHPNLNPTQPRYSLHSLPYFSRIISLSLSLSAALARHTAAAYSCSSCRQIVAAEDDDDPQLPSMPSMPSHHPLPA